MCVLPLDPRVLAMHRLTPGQARQVDVYARAIRGGSAEQVGLAGQQRETDGTATCIAQQQRVHLLKSTQVGRTALVADLRIVGQQRGAVRVEAAHSEAYHIQLSCHCTQSRMLAAKPA